jgi:hypothetical protein
VLLNDGKVMVPPIKAESYPNMAEPMLAEMAKAYTRQL